MRSLNGTNVQQVLLLKRSSQGQLNQHLAMASLCYKPGHSVPNDDKICKKNP